MANQISVTIARLASPLVVKRIVAGTTLGAFLKTNSINYSRSVKVGGRSVTATYRLKNGDIITSSTNVSGG